MNKNLFKKISIIILVPIIFLLMIGLKSSSNIEHSAFVVAIGLDKSPTDKNKVLVTFQIVPPQVTQQNDSNIKKVIVTSLNEDSISSAIGKVQNYISSLINFSHTRVVVFSEELAKEGIINYLNTISSSSQFDTNMSIMVCKSTAEKYLNSLSENTEVNPILYYNILRNSENYNSATKAVTVTEFLKNYYDPCSESITSLCSVSNSKKNSTDNEKKQENGSTNNSSNDTIDNTENTDTSLINKKSDIKIEINGIALFKKDKLIGTLDNNYTTMHLMVSSKIKSAYINLIHPSLDYSKDISTNIYLWQSKKAKTNINLSSQVPYIDISIPINVSITDTQELNYNFSDPKYIEKMKNYIDEYLQEKAVDYFKKVQKEYQIDIDGFSRKIRYNFLTSKDLENYKWCDKYKSAKINTKFEINFISSGLSVTK
ncbi:MAG: Ger(x)C family spore germination protein [Clostridia bacterium]